MTFTFRPAIREDVGLLIGLAGGTGSGKTYTAMRLASGIAGDKRFCVIDTEAGRAKHYADQFKFDHGDLKPPRRVPGIRLCVVDLIRVPVPSVVLKARFPDGEREVHLASGNL